MDDPIVLRHEIDRIREDCVQCRQERRENEGSLFAKVDELRADMNKGFLDVSKALSGLGWKAFAAAISLGVVVLAAILSHIIGK